MRRRDRDETHLYNRDHPGAKILQALKEFKITRRQLAEHIGIERLYLDGVIRGEKPIGRRMASLLAQALRTSVQYWLFAQVDYDYAKWERTTTREGKFELVQPFQMPIERGNPKPLDRCVCGHWGWDHIDGVDGACIVVDENGVECRCGMYLRMYGYLAAMGAMGGIKDLLDEEERQRIAAGGYDGDDSGLPELPDDVSGPAKAGRAGAAVAGKAGQDPAGGD